MVRLSLLLSCFAILLLSSCQLTAAPEAGAAKPKPEKQRVDYAYEQIIQAGDSPELIAEKAAKVLPRPNQTSWMRYERTFFLHFGPNTFRGVEWGDGRESPSLFNPEELDAGQWVDAVAKAGGKLLILVAKHHDGFCLWPSRYTKHSVAASPWKGGKGHLVREVAEAARERGLKLGIYLSPADLYQLRTNPTNPVGLYGNGSPKKRSTIPTETEFFHSDPSRGRPPTPGFRSYSYEVNDYNRYFLNQLYELLTEYGPISVVWFDGANPDPSVPEAYDYAAWYDLIRKLQPEAVISVKGPDVRWVGNEGGYGRSTEWSVLPLPQAPAAHAWPDLQETDLGSRPKLVPGSHLWWYPAEVNTPILNGWFWSAEKRVKSPAELVDYYYRSVGRNGNMLLNLSPDSRGRIPDDQLASLQKMSRVLQDTFSRDLAEGARLTADSSAVSHPTTLARDKDQDTWWEAREGARQAILTLELPEPRSFDVVSLQEAVDHRGQRIESFVVETWDCGSWQSPATLEEQTTVGHKRLVRLATPVSTKRLRLRITGCRLEPTLAEIALFKQSLPKEPSISERSREGLVTLAHPHPRPLVYTLDGTDPSALSPQYKTPLALPQGGTVNAAVLGENGDLGLMASKSFIGLSPKGWRVVEQPGYTPKSGERRAALAIDADASTGWLEAFSPGATTGPSLTVDMGCEQEIEGFAYLPRQDWVFQGVVDRYRFETSVDGQEWRTQVAEGSFGNIRNNPVLQEQHFPKPIRARFFRFTALHEVDGNGWAGAAEITVLPAAGTRQVLSLDAGWRFHLGEAPGSESPFFDDSQWRLVDVPHDYVIEGQFAEKSPVPNKNLPEDWYWLHGFLPVQPAVYRRALHLPESLEGKRVWLEFEGVFSNSRFWLNGRELGTQYSGYTFTRFDVTEVLEKGKENLLVVQVDPRYDGWWYEGGGIYRHVNLVAVDKLHLVPEGVFITTQCTPTGSAEVADADLQIRTEFINAGIRSQSVRLHSEVLDAEDRVIARAEQTWELGAGSSQQLTQNLRLPKAALWSPAQPRLYRLRSSLHSEGRLTDQLITRFGVRKAVFDPDKGFFLNGRPLKLQGVNMHQDHAGVGVAVPDRLFVWRLERLKELGCNAIRMSHNPVPPTLLEACDRLGFLVIAENRHLGDSHADQTSTSAVAVAHRDLSTLIRRDRNHPSIILWSLCNEQWIQGTPESAALALAMKNRVRELDPSRPVTAALNGGFDTPQGMAGVLDVIGINYNPWVYDSVHALFPDKPLLASEIASEIATRGIYDTQAWENYLGDPKRGYVTAYSLCAGPAGQTVEKAWPPVAERPFLGGGFVWSAFDYKGEPRPFGWPVINCHYGVMDICGFPKDSYYYYKALWSEEPVLHLFPHWNWSGREGEEIPVWVHSNCEEVELFLNGKSLGRQKQIPGGHLEWKVKYTPGTLQAKGLRQGRELQASRETTGPAKALRLSADRSRLDADNRDLAVLRVEVLDEAGRLVPTADNMIRFCVEGPAKIIGVGNGDPCCHEPDKGNARSAFQGLAQVLVQTGTSPGKITVRAEAEGLVPFSLTLESL